VRLTALFCFAAITFRFLFNQPKSQQITPD